MHAKLDIKNNLSLQTIFQTKPTELQKSCNCLVKEDCAMNGLCLILSILYQATIKHKDSKYKKKKKKKYNWICEITFKERYTNHKNSFNLIKLSLKMTSPYP